MKKYNRGGGWEREHSIEEAITDHTVNVDCVKFEYVVLAKYHHMLIF